MKRITTFVLIAMIFLSAASAGTEYTTTAMNGGFNLNGEGPSLGLHASYQFGADFTDDFTFGFGSAVDAEFPLLNSEYVLGGNLLFGPAFAVNTNDYTTMTAIIGPAFDFLSHETNEDLDRFGFGLAASVGYTFYPPRERESRMGLGLTLGFTGKLMVSDTGMPYSGINGFIGFTFFGDMMPYYYSPYYDTYDLLLDIILDD